MKAIKILVATLGLAAASAAVAQPHGRFGGPGPRFDLDDLAILLDLDAYQKQEVERAFTQRREAAEAARAARQESGQRPTREEMLAQREKARGEMLATLQSVLSEQQITKLKVLMERPDGAGPRGGRRGLPRDAG